jgi:DnaK suppressor protein
MARKLAKSTVTKFKKRLETERERLEDLLKELEEEREEAKASESASERNPSADSVEGGSMAFEYEKELSIAANTEDLLRKVKHAEERIADKSYGSCEVCGDAIPVARLEALPYTTVCVSCASRR